MAKKSQAQSKEVKKVTVQADAKKVPHEIPHGVSHSQDWQGQTGISHADNWQG